MSEVNDILTQLKTENVRIETNKIVISKAIEKKFGYELPLLKGKARPYGLDTMIDIINALFIALAVAVEENGLSK